MPRRGNPEPRPNMIANPLPATMGLNCGEDVEAGLKPVVDSLRNFNRFVLGVVGGLEAVNYSLAAIYREVRVELDHSGARSYCVVAVDLNFVVVLGGGVG